jgi:hypothetical protein
MPRYHSETGDPAFGKKVSIAAAVQPAQRRLRLDDGAVPKYVLASWMGMLPGTIMYVYVGSAANSLAALLSGEQPRVPGQQVLFALGLAATVAATTIVTRTARRALNDIVPP